MAQDCTQHKLDRIKFRHMGPPGDRATGIAAGSAAEHATAL